MNFAKFARMSPRDRMLAGLRGQMMPTHGVEVSNARGVRLGIAPLQGLGLSISPFDQSQAASVSLPTLTLAAPGASPSTMVQMSRPTLNPITPPANNVAPVTTSTSSGGGGGGGGGGSSSDDFSFDKGTFARGTPGSQDDVANSQTVDDTASGAERGGVTSIEDAQKNNIMQLQTNQSARASTGSLFDRIPKWVWPVGLVAVAWLVFRKS